MQTLEIFFQFFSQNSREVLEIYMLAKSLTPILTEFFQFLSRLCTYLSGIHSLKHNSAVSRSGQLHEVNKTFFPTNNFNFSKLEVLLSKSTLKYLICCQVFWVKVRRLRNKCTSILALVFYYCISNNLSREKTVK